MGTFSVATNSVNVWTASQSFTDDTVLFSRTNSNRGTAGTAGRIIFNTDDAAINVDDGTDWTDAAGTAT